MVDLGLEHPPTALVSFSSKSQKLNVVCSRCHHNFYSAIMTSPNNLVEYSRNLGLEVTSMVIRCLAKMTRTETS